MTSIELKAWRKRHNLSLIQAADALALTMGGLISSLYRPREVGKQTSRIAQLMDEKVALESRLVEQASIAFRGVNVHQQPYIASGFDGC